MITDCSARRDLAALGISAEQYHEVPSEGLCRCMAWSGSLRQVSMGCSRQVAWQGPGREVLGMARGLLQPQQKMGEASPDRKQEQTLWGVMDHCKNVGCTVGRRAGQGLRDRQGNPSNWRCRPRSEAPQLEVPGVWW